MTYQQAVEMFRRQYPTVDPYQNNDLFNQWSGSTFGAGGFEAANYVPPPGGTTGVEVNPTAVNLFGNAGNALNQAISGATVNPNTTQVQGGQQYGSYTSQGGTTTSGTQEQTGSKASTSDETQTGTTLATSEQAGTTAGQQATATTQEQAGATTSDVAKAGTTSGTTSVVDTLGLGGLLTGQAGAATSADAARNAFLQGLVTQGPKQQQALTSAAVNQALSGPGMYGTGQGAQARAAGTAASLVGLNSLNQQLEAARELAGPSATTTLASAGNPYLGQTTTGKTEGTESTVGTTAGTTTGTTVGEQAGQTTQTGAQNTVSDLAKTANSLDLTNMLNKTQGTTAETQSGESGNVGVTAGIGTVPQNTTQGGGGCYACTAYVDMGWQMHRAIRAAAEWKLSRPEYRRSLAGYSVYGPSLARAILRSATFAKVFFPVAKAVLHEELRLAGRVSQRRFFATLCHAGFHYGSLAVAVLTGRTSIKQCDSGTANLLSRNNLYLEV